jgi:hypothetical protein
MVLVLDHLNTPRPVSLDEAFAPHAWPLVEPGRDRLCMQAVRATFAAFPAARRRAYNALSIGVERTAPRVLMSRVARPWAIVRLPRRVPLSQCKRATPTRAARHWRLSVPNSGRPNTRGRAQTAPIPDTLCSNSSRLRQTGLARRVVSKSSSRAARHS